MRKTTFCVFASMAVLSGCGDDSSTSHANEPRHDASTPAERDGSVGDDGHHSHDGTPPPDAGTEDGGGIPRSSVNGNTIEIGPIPTAAGEEHTVCVVLELPNDTEIAARGLHVTLREGSHHMIVYRTDEAERRVPYGCSPNPSDSDMFVMAQSRERTLDIPADAVLRIPAHQRLRMELHYFNDTGKPLDVGGTVSITPHEGDSTGLADVHTRFTGEFSITVPPGESEVRSFFPVTEGERFFALTTHTHRLGVLATLSRATSAEDPEPELLHESRTWSEPPLTVLDPPMTFDGKGLLLTCKYNNDTGQTVSFGLSALDEMCFFWGYYY